MTVNYQIDPLALRSVAVALRTVAKCFSSAGSHDAGGLLKDFIWPAEKKRFNLPKGASELGLFFFFPSLECASVNDVSTFQLLELNKKKKDAM